MKQCTFFWSRLETVKAVDDHGNEHIVGGSVSHACKLTRDHGTDHECKCGKTLSR